jgi:predicted GIY-YIG superfamily endonuclease
MIYVGYTKVLQQRLQEHKDKNPELVYYEAYKDKKDAQKRERMLKHYGQTLRRLQERLKNSL